MLPPRAGGLYKRKLRGRPQSALVCCLCGGPVEAFFPEMALFSLASAALQLPGEAAVCSAVRIREIGAGAGVRPCRAHAIWGRCITIVRCGPNVPFGLVRFNIDPPLIYPCLNLE